ncbi:MAG TPA: hypothetical protein VEC75_10020, partial [Stellaceae bacterium]|nr:hypothetical protein [Stellaceae bacterium]
SDRVLAPIVIGITGKRELNGRENAVRSAIRRLLQRLDDRYPNGPKILLSALAEGADTIAAEEALGRKDWQVVASLPLPLDLYAEDFSESGAARLRKMVADPRVRSRELPFLRPPEGAAELDREALRRREGVPNPLRTHHYEQVGLFIADRATILIAIMPASEKPDRIGGTARIVHYRLNGPFDDTSHDVLERSRVLHPPELLDSVRSGPVWLVDPATADAPGDFPASVLLPPDRTVGWPRTPSRLLAASLALVDRLDRFNRRVLTIPEERWQASVVRLAGDDTGDATAMLRYLRRAMSAIQGDANRWRKRSVLALAGLFWLAAAMVELREGFWIFRTLWWSCYLIFGVVAVIIYLIAARSFWQEISEDYRAVAEALRVQVAWWEAGLQGPEHRVERMFLCGTSGALALVRAAVRQCVDAALLLRDPKPPSEHAHERWIEDQIRYFDARISARRKYLLAADTSTWILFLGALGAAAFVALGPFAPGALEAYFGALDAWWYHVPKGTIFLATFLVLALASLGGIWLEVSGVLRRIEHRHLTVQLLSLFVVVLMGMTFAASLYDLAAFFLDHGMLVDVTSDPLIKAMSEQYCPSSSEAPSAGSTPFILLGQAFAELVAVVPAAIAGAIRYVAEKFSWEAELNGYEDTLRTFRRAKVELSAVEGQRISTETKHLRRRDLLVALGKEALEESEAWIRAHRERLIEPVV